MRRMWLALPLLFASLAVTAQQRSIELDDLERLKEVSDPEIAPDGQWILYTVSTIAKDADHRESQLWEVSWDGATTIQLTSGHDGVGHARWSPDGKYISFTSSRTGPAKGPQIWVLDRRGGEARQFTALKGRIGNYAWSPDSQRIALIYHEGRAGWAAHAGCRSGSCRRCTRRPEADCCGSLRIQTGWSGLHCRRRSLADLLLYCGDREGRASDGSQGCG